MELKRHLFDFIYINFLNNIILSFNKQIPKKLVSKETNIIEANSFDYSMALKISKLKKIR